MVSSQLVSEERRHRRMVFTLMAGCLAAGVAVSNERGVFVPPHSLGAAFAATARAFAALAGLPGRFNLYTPVAAEAYRLPNELAQRIFNPPPPPANPLPGVFGAPPGGFGAPPAAAAPLAVAPSTFTPAGGEGGPGGLGPIGPAGPGGFTGLPTPLPEVGTTPTTPTTPGVNPPVIIPGGGTTPPFVTPPGPPTVILTPPVPPTIVIPPPGTNPNPPVINPVPPITTPENPVPPVTPPTNAVPEPASWAMLILGFGIVGGLQRLAGRRKRRQAA